MIDEKCSKTSLFKVDEEKTSAVNHKELKSFLVKQIKNDEILMRKMKEVQYT